MALGQIEINQLIADQRGRWRQRERLLESLAGVSIFVLMPESEAGQERECGIGRELLLHAGVKQERLIETSLRAVGRTEQKLGAPGIRLIANERLEGGEGGRRIATADV